MREKLSGLRKLSHTPSNRCFGCGQANPHGLRLEFLADQNGRVFSALKASREFEGPPGFMHGGIIATLLDEAMSKACRAQEVVAMTRQMEVEYLRPVPLGMQLVVEGRHVHAEQRKHRCEAEVRLEDGGVLAKARGLFISIDAAQMFGSE